MTQEESMHKLNKGLEKRIKKIIENSGNNFHTKVVRLLRDNGWEVLISPYYNDNVTNKPREIDIVAEKSYQVYDQRRRASLGDLSLRIFIECKYISKEVVCWFDAKDHKRAIKAAEKQIQFNDSYDYNYKNHHYSKDEKVAKLFSSESGRNQERDIFYAALNQTINAFVSHRDSGSIILDDDYQPKKVLKIINYPIIICNDFNKMYRIDIGENNPQKIVNNFQLEVNYAYLDQGKRNISEYFLIDIIAIDKLLEFLDGLEKTEIDKIKGILAYQYGKRKNTPEDNS
ncbi:MAG: hypothetical protein WC645_06140 [Candidatus Margulisiibacteriota bacterium]